MRRSRTLAIVVPWALLVVVLLFGSAGEAVSQAIREVFVTNFPEVQRVEGKVQIDNPVALSHLVTFPDVLVPPVRPEETTRLVEAGVLTTEGFPKVVLSLHGRVKGSVGKTGEVGAILLPDQPTVQEAFNELGLVHFSLSATARDVSLQTPYFASSQPTHTVAFQAYRVLLYNTTDKTVTVSLFAYLTS